MAETDTASGDAPSATVGQPTSQSGEPRLPAPISASVTAPGASAAPRLTLLQHALRIVVVAVTFLVCVLLLAPVIVAIVAAIWALVTDTFAVLTITRLVRQGSILQTDAAMTALTIGSRVGFAAVGYLGLFFALMTLLSGLFGRGRGRLFIIPGALLTASGLILFATSVALCWPLLAPLHAPHAALIGLALYLTFDTIALASLLADARETRRWLRRRRTRATRRHSPKQAIERRPPDTPPTLAGA